MNQFGKNIFSNDRKFLAGAVLLIMASLYYLLVDETFFGLLAAKDEDVSRAVVGEILKLENDTRHRTKTSFTWSKAKVSQQIRLGDSVFTGAASSSLVDLKQGGSLKMGANTLIVFDDIKGLKVPNLKMGNFKLSVNGSLKVGIANDITVLSGNGSEVEISVEDKKKPTIKITKGDVQVETKSAEVVRRDPPPQPLLDLKPTVAEALPIPPAKPEPPAVEVQPPPPAPVEASVHVVPGIQSYLYTDQMYDFYENVDGRLTKRKERRRFGAMPVRLQWTTAGNLTKVYGQVSETPSFDKSVQFFQSSDLTGHTINPIYVGTNYWRISKDGHSWSSPEFFIVETQALESAPPQIKLSQSILTILGDGAQVRMNLEASPELKGFLIESSQSSEFPVKSTKIKWTTQKDHTYRFSSTGTYYIRARGVNEKTELSVYGPVMKLVVVKPEKISSPLLTKNKFQLYEKETLQLAWASDEAAKSYQVEIKNEKGQLVEQRKVPSADIKWQADIPGNYQAEVYSFDQYGRRSESPSVASLQVLPRPVARKLPPKKIEERKPASVESQSVAKIDDPTMKYLNRNVGSSRFEILGAGFTMYSSEQVSQQVEQPFALTLGFRWLKWFGDNGAEASLRTKVIGVNSSASQASPLQAEFRYNRRWGLNWNWFSNRKTTYVGLIAGYEMYRNQSSSVFASTYDLFKTGFSLGFPLGRGWDTGGDVLYGFGSDSSKKYELSGYLNYFFTQEFSAGVGYRLHLFEAGSTSSAPPSGLPYREGYGEGYSSLRWHF